MSSKSYLLACAASLLAGAALAQAPPALNLKLPANAAPASSATAAKPATDPPGTYYGDTSGRMGNTVANTVASTVECDDSTYNQPQVHGSVGVGVMSGRHVGTGTFNTGNINVTKQYGSCDDPSGGMSMSISVGGAHFNGGGRDH
jgi:hypothetical protein